jgi:Dolichyl-phosphate-mannose-protein mannosyltransferase
MITSSQPLNDRAAFVVAMLVLAGAALACFHVALQSDVRHLLVIVADDASYFMTTARNIAAGRGMTFDGIHPTNGFHPLWLLLLAALFLLHGTPELMLRLVLLLQGLLLAAAFLLLYRAHARMFSARTALVSAILFIFLVALQCLNGMESALFTLLLMALYSYGLRLSQRPFSLKQALLFGVMLGFVVLSRLDMLFIGVAVLICCAPYVVDRRTRSRTVAAIIVAGLGSCAVVTPYLLFNYAQSGAIMPISGALKSSFPIVALSADTRAAIDPRFYACVALAVGWLLWRMVRTASPPPTRGDSYFSLSTTVVAWAVLLHFLHTLLFMKWGVFAWHFVLYRLFAVLLSAAIIDSLLRSKPAISTPGYWFYWATLTVLLALATVKEYTADWYSLNGSWHAAVYNAALWAREHTDERAIFAMSDSGHFAYFSCRRVINLDGLANNMEYQQAIADRHVNQYLRDNQVGYLVQHAVHGHDDVVRGDYVSMALRFESHRFGGLSDAVVVRRQDEVYRSPQYFDGSDAVVLLIWSL